MATEPERLGLGGTERRGIPRHISAHYAVSELCLSHWHRLAATEVGGDYMPRAVHRQLAGNLRKHAPPRPPPQPPTTP